MSTLVDWQDPDKWASWETCWWEPSGNSVSWGCTLPKGHQGEHVGYLSMEADPTSTSYVGFPGDKEWRTPKRCPVCGRTHPGYRHSTRNDPVAIFGNNEGNWGPEKNPNFPDDGTEIQLNGFVPTFVDVFPTPPKFANVEEAEAWLETNAP